MNLAPLGVSAWQTSSNATIGTVWACVHDGHNGGRAAGYLRERLAAAVAEHLTPVAAAAAANAAAAAAAAADVAASSDGGSGGGNGGAGGGGGGGENKTRFASSVACALVEAFEATDTALLAAQKASGDESGSTCVGCLAMLGRGSDGGGGGGLVAVANVGDSRAVLCCAAPAAAPAKKAASPQEVSGHGLRYKGVALSEDQKAERPDEKARVLARGGVVFRGRLMGVLAVSRAFGDPELKVREVTRAVLWWSDW